MQIFVRGPAKLLAINIEKDNAIQDVYEHIAQESGYAVNDIVLSLHGAPLNNEQCVGEFDVAEGTTIDAHVKVLGGKTHGRIGNAGKVKNATPVVPPTEKPKQKTGRARRRAQYAQRFSTKVVSPNGVRRGPNSNY